MVRQAMIVFLLQEFVRGGSLAVMQYGIVVVHVK